MDRQVREIREAYQVYEREAQMVRRKFDDFLKDEFLNSFDPTELDDFLHSIMISFKGELQKIKEAFERDYGGQMVDKDCYYYHIELQKFILTQSNIFCEKVARRMTWDFSDKSDLRNLIKQCPHWE
jgi:hypothetical protein